MPLLLYNALLNERSSKSEGVWVDQLCINQDNEAEKQITVNSMDIIYKCARAVVILLDDVEITENEQDALRAYIREYEAAGETHDGFRNPHYDDDPPYITTNILMRAVYEKILQARWFSRAWCMHEARLGKRHIFLIPCEEQPDSLPKVFRFTNFFMMHFLGLGGSIQQTERKWMWIVTVLTNAILSIEETKRHPSCLQVFTETFRQDAGGNPRIESLEARKFDANLDKLSIAVNSIDLGLSLSPRARDIENGLPPPTEDECCRRFTIAAIATCDPSAMCTSGHELEICSALRSWMRWPLFNDSLAFRLRQRKPWTIDFDPSPASGWIMLQMGVFDRAGGLRWATESRIKVCLEFLRSCNGRGIIFHSLTFKELNLPSKVWVDLIIKTLACLMECGIEWLSLAPLARTGLQKFLDREAEISQNDPAKTTATWTAVENLEAQSLMDLAMHLIYRGPAVETKLGQSMEFWQPVCIANETGSKALTFVRRLPEREAFGATPIVLFPDMPDAYSDLFRAWTLVKGEPEREQQPNGDWAWKYHLMGKSRIFGNIANGKIEPTFTSFIDKVKVYGPVDLPL